MNPLDLFQVLSSISQVGAAVKLDNSASLVHSNLLNRVSKSYARATHLLNTKGHGIRPVVLFVEWTDPLFPGGHWTPQLIYMAGGSHPIAQPQVTGNGLHDIQGAGPSLRTPASKILDAVTAPLPSHIIIAPCGLDLSAARREADILYSKSSSTAPSWFRTILDRQQHRQQHVKVCVVDGNQMFNRPGPRLVDALEWLVDWIWDDTDSPKEVASFPWEEWLPPIDGN